jgi:maltooligosyltrehalose trehalohydrolase
MLFQGQEFAATAPFAYFADHNPELRKNVKAGRREFLMQFPNIADPDVQPLLPTPDRVTFERCKLDFSERARHAEWYALHRDLIRIRRDDLVIRRAARRPPEGSVLSADAFALRYRGGADDDRLLLVNLGIDLDLHPIPEPLLAPPAGCDWVLEWSSESPRYGGNGTAPLHPHDHFHMPGQAAVLLRSESRGHRSGQQRGGP